MTLLKRRKMQMKKSKATQRSEVFMYLTKNGTITSIEAFEKFGATRLAAIIFDLRKHGHVIDTIDMSGKNRYDETATYAKYKYIGYNGLDNTIAIRKMRGEI
jgi:hypothetical protein